MEMRVWLCFAVIRRAAACTGRQRGAVAVGEEAEVADAYEARWQQMEQEAAQELMDVQSHESLLVAMRRSRHRKVTLPWERATSLLLEMATR